MARLAGKVALITGGGTGIGRACALLFAREGAQVAVAGRRVGVLEEAVGAIAAQGGKALAAACDVSKPEEVRRGIREVVERFGRLDVVVNSAGALLVATAEETSEAQWHELLAVNLTGTFLVSRAALPELRRAGGGSIVNIGSIFGLVGMKKRAAYAATKGGVTMLTRAMALDHAKEGIRVNCICPAIVRTAAAEEMASRQPDPPAYLRMRAAQIPLGRLGKPEDVANLALFLASDESSWLTGAALPLDGGQSAA